MIYRTLGKTGLKVSALGFGTMRLPMAADDKSVDRERALPLFGAAFEGGINYIDSAVGYCSQDSQRVCGAALAEWFAAGHPRNSIVVSTKNPHYDKADKAKWWTNLENSLERLRVEQIDVYHHHSLDWKSFTEHVQGPDGLYREMLRARDQGLIRFIGFSWHDEVEHLFKVIDSGLFDSMTCQYNLISRTNEEAFAHAHARGMGVVVMGPVAGGRLGATAGPLGESLPAGVATTPELALRFVLANPNVSVALSGMTKLQDVRENLKTASRAAALTAAERREMKDVVERMKKLADLYCTGCRYCEPCPQNIRIGDIFHHVIVHNVYGAKAAAIHGYAYMKKHSPAQGKRMADACKECGECEKKCPQKIPIIQQLKEARKLLDRG